MPCRPRPPLFFCRLAFFVLLAALAPTLATPVPCLGLDDAPRDAATAAAALAILDAYHADRPRPGERTLRIICWRPLDRPFAPDHCERLTRIMQHIQKFYADEMQRNGFGPRTIQLNYDDDKSLTIHHAVGSANFAGCTKPEGERVRQDCLAGAEGRWSRPRPREDGRRESLE